MGMSNALHVIKVLLRTVTTLSAALIQIISVPIAKKMELAWLVLQNCICLVLAASTVLMVAPPALQGFAAQHVCLDTTFHPITHVSVAWMAVMIVAPLEFATIAQLPDTIRSTKNA
jgi:hypothetical protein